MRNTSNDLSGIVTTVKACFMRNSSNDLPECAKHVLAQLYHEHLYDYEIFANNRLVSQDNGKNRENHRKVKPDDQPSVSGSKDEGRNLPGSTKDTNDGEASRVSSSRKRRNQKVTGMASSEHHANSDGTAGKNTGSPGARK